MPKFLDTLSSGWATVRSIISDALAHKSTTYAAVIVGITTIGQMVQSVADTFGQLAAVKGLAAPIIAHAVVASEKFGAIASVCFIFAAFGKSIILRPQPTVDTPPTDPGATTFHVIPGSDAASVTTQLTIVPKSDEEKKAA